MRVYAQTTERLLAMLNEDISEELEARIEKELELRDYDVKRSFVMTKTQANEVISIHVQVFARKTGRAIDRYLVDEIRSEYMGNHNGPYLMIAALKSTTEEALRLAIREARAQTDS